MTTIRKLPDGGPAFACAACNGHNEGQAGMSLRDYFAAKALQGMLCNGFMPSECYQHGRIPTDYPSAAYEIADAMLKASGE